MGSRPGTAEFTYVETAAELERICARIAGTDWLAIDTEFIRESTYYPRLCLLQIATADLNACIDPLRLERLDPLLAVLFDPAVTKVMHACRQDMELFFHLFERLPAPVFDTQVAAPLLGLPCQAGYATLVEELMGIRLDKSHTRTDWARRPLSAEQLAYAVEDVCHLGPLYLRLRDDLQRLGRLDWLDEDFAVLTDPELYRNPPQSAWKRIRGGARLSGPQLAALQALAAWRETRARDEDMPRAWLVRDEALLDIARMRPRDREQLGRLRSLKKDTMTRYGAELLDAVTRSADKEAPPAPAKGQPPAPGQEALVDVMMALVRVKGAEHGINPAVIASRNDLVRLLNRDADASVLHGWRKKLVGRALVELLNGRLTLRAGDGRLKLEDDDGDGPQSG